MSFNPDFSEQAQEIFFSRKTHKISHPKVNFNNSPAAQSTYQKHLGLHLDKKLNFLIILNVILISKSYRGIGLIQKRKNHY